MAFRIVSYCTEKTIYEKVMQNYLYPCLGVLGIPHFITTIADCGSWEVNASYQPHVIWMAMKTFENENIVWMDSDILINDYPFLFNDIPTRCDIGVYYLRYEDHWGIPAEGKETPKPVLKTSVLYFKNSPKMRDFVYEWMTRTAKEQKKSHRTHLAELIDDRLSDDLSFFLLPRSHAYEAIREDGQLPVAPMQYPVVMNFVASLQTRKNLYGGAE